MDENYALLRKRRKAYWRRQRRRRKKLLLLKRRKRRQLERQKRRELRKEKRKEKQKNKMQYKYYNKNKFNIQKPLSFGVSKKLEISNNSSVLSKLKIASFLSKKRNSINSFVLSQYCLALQQKYLRKYNFLNPCKETTPLFHNYSYFFESLENIYIIGIHYQKIEFLILGKYLLLNEIRKILILKNIEKERDLCLFNKE